MTVTIAGKEYEVRDFDKTLTQKGNSHNTLSFADTKEEDDGFYTFAYDPEIGRILHKDGYIKAWQQSIQVHKSVFDGPGLDKKWIDSLNQAALQFSLGCIINGGTIGERLQGKQVEIDINGDTYFLNSHFLLLEPRDFRFSAIRLLESQRLSTGAYHLLLDKFTKEPVRSGVLRKAGQRRLIFVRIPDLKTADPVGFARRVYNNPFLLLDSTSFAPRVNAEVVPVNLHNISRIAMNFCRNDIDMATLGPDGRNKLKIEGRKPDNRRRI